MRSCQAKYAFNFMKFKIRNGHNECTMEVLTSNFSIDLYTVMATNKERYELSPPWRRL